MAQLVLFQCTEIPQVQGLPWEWHFYQLYPVLFELAKKVCEDLADLLLNEKVQITIADPATDTFVKQVLTDNAWEELGNEFQEWKAALGNRGLCGVYPGWTGGRSREHDRGQDRGSTMWMH